MTAETYKRGFNISSEAVATAASEADRADDDDDDDDDDGAVHYEHHYDGRTEPSRAKPVARSA